MLKLALLATILGLPLCYGGGPVVYKGIPGLGEPTGLPYFRVSLDDRTNCTDGQTDGEVAGRGNTTAEVDDLLVEMAAKNFQAYIVPTADAHGSEYTAEADERRAFITDFTGSAGTAVILSNGTRALWTDGRYFIQADQQLDCTWILMKEGEPDVPTISEWLNDVLADGSNVGADSRLFSSVYWNNLDAALTSNLVVETLNNGLNIVDEVWANYGRPSYSMSDIFVHDIQYAGQDWRDKILEMEDEMINYGAEVYVVSMLDESAWLFNLRGADIPYNPVFRSYVIIDRSSRTPSSVTAFIPDINEKVTQAVLDHLDVDNCVLGVPCVSIVDYDSIGTALSTLSAQSSVTKVLVPTTASYYIYNLVPAAKREVVRSPIMLEKARKNPVECDAMKTAHIKDATALYQFMTFMENEMALGQTSYTEISAMEILDGYRYAQPNNMGLSFNTISAFGSNAAIIHYSPTVDTDALITDQNVYLVDSGGQYLEGTTDVTRTFHFGQPEDIQPIVIEAYTRVLMGNIDMATLIFPPGTNQEYTDILTRRYLYEVGWDFNHSPSHGVGMFLNVHENSHEDYEWGWHGSDEPGYYQDGDFGIRLESMVAVVNVTTKYDFVETSFGFDTLTLFPMEPKLINTTLLTPAHCDYLNSWNLQIRDIMGTHLTNEGLAAEYNYMMSKTEQYNC